MRSRAVLFLGAVAASSLAVAAAQGADPIPGTTGRPADLVGYWKLDEGLGTRVMDFSGGQAHGDIHGEAKWEIDKQYGSVLRFDGKTAYVGIPDDAWNNAAPFTIMAWVMPDKPAGRICDHLMGGAVPGVYCLDASGFFGGYDAENGSKRLGELAAATGKWSFVAVTVAPTELRGYLNGEPRMSLPIKGWPRLDGGLSLGARECAHDTFYAGLIREVAIFKRALGADEIAAIHAKYQGGASLYQPPPGPRLTSVRSDKIFYRPGEKAGIVCDVGNPSGQPVDCTITLTLTSGLNDERTVGKKTLKLAPWKGEAVAFEIPIGPGNAFGHEYAAVLKDPAGRELSRLADVFAAADNFWEVAIGVDQARNGLFHNTGRLGDRSPEFVRQAITDMRANYCNWFEKSFWAPDDWGDMTPDTETWVSGQAARCENVKCLKALIDEGHKYGIHAVTYGKGMAGGPSAWEVLRRKPSFFARDKASGRWGSNPDLWDFDHWSDDAFHQKYYDQFSSDWHRLSPDLTNVAALDYGIDEIIGSARMFGWDGVRFDGHFSAVDDVVSTWNMQRLKRRVWDALPDFRFGFNLCSVHDRKGALPHEEREAMAGGGMWMNEAMGQWTFEADRVFTSWRQYAEKEKEAALRVQAAGGSYHYIYRLDRQKEVASYYKFTIGTLNGAHPAYGGHEWLPGCPNWGRFLTRWGQLFWDRRRAFVDTPAAKLAVGNAPANLLWRDWPATTPTLRGELLAVPLLLLPETDAIADTKAYPAPAAGVTVRIVDPALRKRAKSFAWLVPGAAPSPLKSGRDGTVALPEIKGLALLLVELDGAGGKAAVAPTAKYTEAVSDAERESHLAKGNRVMNIDPLRPTLNAANPTDGSTVRKYAADTSWSMARAVFEDPEAEGGRATGADKAFPSCCTGQYFWNDELSPGRYRITIRVKAENLDTPQIKANLYENILKGPPPFTVIEKQIPYPGKGDGKYHEIVVTDDYEHFGIGFCAAFIGCNLPKDAPANARILLDWVQIERLATYSDADIIKRVPLEKIAQALKLMRKKGNAQAPGEPAVKEGVEPGAGESAKQACGPRNDILWIRGLYDDLYGIEPAAKAAFADAKVTTRYQRDFPLSARDLAVYGTLILPNIPVEMMGVPFRQDIRDWALAGGHLIILGGTFGLGQGKMRGTFLEDLLPCELTRDADVVELPPHSEMTMRPDAAKAAGMTVGKSVVFFAHDVKPKPSATVLADCGKLPLLMTQRTGKGRCTVFAGTVLGAAKDDPQAFWNAKTWTEMLSKAIAEF